MSTDVFLPHVAQASGSGFNAADARRLHTRLHGIQGLVMDDASRSQFATDSRESLRRHLLILTARNRLLNLTHGRAGNVRVIDELPDDLHPPLLSETEVRFSAVPDPTREHLIEFVYLRNDLDTGLDEPVTQRPHGGVVGQDARAGAALRSAEPASGRGGRSVLVPGDERA